MKCTQTEWTVEQLGWWLIEISRSHGAGTLIKLGSFDGELLHTVKTDSDRSGWVHVVLT